ncbi:ester cyclase [Rhodococcus sp. T2V]|uniref:ester cyclase n=1 Tax=Rhodococcus sp. T2V TaxID=3034164 RepID=UPI0023E22F94|nr:ester cyclase [Rhodococcus sp. T2V]MDF3305304.1 ester cyclase [Rhodococcus sp. T2V]
MPNDPETEELVKGYVRAIGSGDLERVWAFYADNIVYEDTAVNQVYYGIDAVKEFYTKSMSALGVRWLVDTCYATDEGFAIAWHMGGIHEHDLPGMPATGKFFTVPGASIARVKNGKIVRNRDFWNNLDLLRQLGLA